MSFEIKVPPSGGAQMVVGQEELRRRFEGRAVPGNVAAILSMGWVGAIASILWAVAT